MQKVKNNWLERRGIGKFNVPMVCWVKKTVSNIDVNLREVYISILVESSVNFTLAISLLPLAHTIDRIHIETHDTRVSLRGFGTLTSSYRTGWVWWMNSERERLNFWSHEPRVWFERIAIEIVSHCSKLVLFFYCTVCSALCVMMLSPPTPFSMTLD